MSSVSWPTAAKSTTKNLEIVPIGRQHIAGYHAALDGIAKERRYLAMLEAPSFQRTRRFVLDSLRAGAVHVVAVVDDGVIGWCDLRPKAAPTLQHTAVLGMGIAAAYRGQGIGSRLLATRPRTGAGARDPAVRVARALGQRSGHRAVSTVRLRRRRHLPQLRLYRRRRLRRAADGAAGTGDRVGARFGAGHRPTSAIIVRLGPGVRDEACQRPRIPLFILTFSRVVPTGTQVARLWRNERNGNGCPDQDAAFTAAASFLRRGSPLELQGCGGPPVADALGRQPPGQGTRGTTRRLAVPATNPFRRADAGRPTTAR